MSVELNPEVLRSNLGGPGDTGGRGFGPDGVLCRLIGIGALGTGAVMAVMSSGVSASSSGALADAVVHTSNVKFMAAMWCVMGVMFVIGSEHLHDAGTWRLMRIASIGISVAATVRLVEMVRLDDPSVYGFAAATVELIVPGILIYLRSRSATGGAQ